MPKVLVVATSRKTRGGITSVIKAYETGYTWKKYHCHWVQTHRDGDAWRKILYFLAGLLDYVLRLPFYDIIHIHISHNTTAKRKSIFMFLAKLMKKETVIHFHAFNVEDSILGTCQSYYKYLFDNADRVLVLSRWWKKQVESVFLLPTHKLQILYNPCPFVNQNHSKKFPIILYAGTINQRKGYADLIKAFSRIASKYPNWKVFFIGNGEIEKGKELARSLQAESQIEFLGWISGSRKDEIFRKASIFCLPSYAEGFPMAVLDAWAYNLPVITTPVGGMPDVAVDGENMLLFNPGDVDTLARQLERMITDENLRNHISEASHHFATHEFNIDTINKQLDALYSELLNKETSF